MAFSPNHNQVKCALLGVFTVIAIRQAIPHIAIESLFWYVVLCSCQWSPAKAVFAVLRCGNSVQKAVCCLVDSSKFTALMQYGVLHNIIQFQCSG